MTCQHEPEIDKEGIEEPEQIKEGGGTTLSAEDRGISHENPMTNKQGGERDIDDLK
jgi:hypothetical protein